MRLELARLIETEAALLSLRDNVDRQRQVHDEATKELERARAVLRDAKIAATVDDNDDALDKLRARRAELHREMFETVGARSLLRYSILVFEKRLGYKDSLVNKIDSLPQVVIDVRRWAILANKI